MFKKILFCVAIISTLLITGCASVPMASKEQDAALKAFSPPVGDKSNLYVYRGSGPGTALKKSLYLDGTFLGETAGSTYFFKEISPGEHKLSTESEFSENSISFTAAAGKNYFAQQYIKLGVFVGGAGLRMVPDAKAKKDIRKCGLAKQGLPEFKSANTKKKK